LDKWHSEFNKTKRDIEDQLTVKRWDFEKIKEIFKSPIYMRSVLEHLKEACIIIQEFFSILGPDLKAVTGDVE